MDLARPGTIEHTWVQNRAKRIAAAKNPTWVGFHTFLTNNEFPSISMYCDCETCQADRIIEDAYDDDQTPCSSCGSTFGNSCGDCTDAPEWHSHPDDCYCGLCIFVKGTPGT